MLRFDEVSRLRDFHGMTEIEQQARDVLRHYPRIYVACHVDHTARRGQGEAITARDQTILAHVPDAGVRPHDLAAHLDVAASTLSEALRRLAGMDLVTLDADPLDGRARIVRLTRKGLAALAETSVLDMARITASLMRLSAAERDAVVRGLSLLADAAQDVKTGAT